MVAPTADLSIDVLVHISYQLTRLAPGSDSENAPDPFIIRPSLKAPTSTIWINTLWLISLVLSLITASLGMLVQQWLREYMIMGFVDPQECARIRRFRYEGLVAWKVLEIAALLPLLLQLSLILFFIGLCEFIRESNQVVGWCITGLIGLWLFLYSLTVTAPIFSANCPFKTPFLTPAYQYLRKLLRITYHVECRTPQVEKFIRRTPIFDSLVLKAADQIFHDNEGLEMVRECLEDCDVETAKDSVSQIYAHRSFLSRRRSRRHSIPLFLPLGPDHTSHEERLTLAHTMIDILNRHLSTPLDPLGLPSPPVITSVLHPLVVTSVSSIIQLQLHSSREFLCLERLLGSEQEVVDLVLQVLTYHPSSSFFYSQRFDPPVIGDDGETQSYPIVP